MPEAVWVVEYFGVYIKENLAQNRLSCANKKVETPLFFSHCPLLCCKRFVNFENSMSVFALPCLGGYMRGF